MYNNTTAMHNTALNEQSELSYLCLYGNTNGKIIFYTQTISCFLLGLFLFGGIIAYETFGGDPQKRSILNRLLSMILSCLLVYEAIKGTARIVRDVGGLLDYNSALWIQFFGSWMKISAVSFYNELTILRFAFIVIWKRMKVINDGLLAFLIAASTLAASGSMALNGFMIGAQTDAMWRFPSIMIENAAEKENQDIDR